MFSCLVGHFLLFCSNFWVSIQHRDLNARVDRHREKISLLQLKKDCKTEFFCSKEMDKFSPVKRFTSLFCLLWRNESLKENKKTSRNFKGKSVLTLCEDGMKRETPPTYNQFRRIAQEPKGRTCFNS